jgi:tetratricopeptide (TPR) repeat protein
MAPLRGASIGSAGLARGYDVAKSLLAPGTESEAIKLFQRAKNVGEELAAEPGDSDLILRLLGRVDSYLGEYAAKEGHKQAAESSYRTSNRRFREVYDHKPDDLEALMELCTSGVQLQNYFAGEKRHDEATKFALEVCHLLEVSSGRAAWRDSDRLRIRSRLIGAYYMLEMAHAENQQALDGKPARALEMLKEIAAFESACRKVHELAEPLRSILPNDPDLIYFDCMSCANLYAILSSRGQTKEADHWLVEANRLIPSDLEHFQDAQRRETYQAIRGHYEKAHPPAK